MLGDSVQDNLQKMERFFKYNLNIKKILFETNPKEEYGYSKDSIIEYSERLFKVLNDIEYYMETMLDLFSFLDVDKEYLKKYIKALKDELIKIGYNFNDLKQFYKVCFSNMSEELINKVGTNCIGYYFGGVTLKEGKSVNELLHIIHQTVVNDESNYKSN